MPPTISATILVLEENAAVQELIDHVLRESGHRFLSTRNVLEAIEVVRRVRVDVLIAGVLLERRGEALVDEFRSIQPGLRIVNISDSDDDLQKLDHTVRLSSPFALDDLCEAIAAGLEHGGDPAPVRVRRPRRLRPGPGKPF